MTLAVAIAALAFSGARSVGVRGLGQGARATPPSLLAPPPVLSLSAVTSLLLTTTLLDTHDKFSAAELSGGAVDASLDGVMYTVIAVSLFMALRIATRELRTDGGASHLKAAADSPRETEFGWLHADLRMPLPSYEELNEACHLIGMRDGRRRYLCVAESDAQKGDAQKGAAKGVVAKRVIAKGVIGKSEGHQQR